MSFVLTPLLSPLSLPFLIGIPSLFHGRHHFTVRNTNLSLSCCLILLHLDDQLAALQVGRKYLRKKQAYCTSGLEGTVGSVGFRLWFLICAVAISKKRERERESFCGRVGIVNEEPRNLLKLLAAYQVLSSLLNTTVNISMRRESVTESWLDNFWRGSRYKVQEHDKAMMGILSFEVVSLMSKVVKLWYRLRDVEILRLREEMATSVGIRKLVSEDDSYLMNLVLDEIIHNFVYVARAVVRLSRRCADPVYLQIGSFFDDPINNYTKWFGWEYKWKKMDRRVKKMERFITVMLQLTQEQEMLAELQQTVRKMKGNPMSEHVKLFEFQQKVTWQIQVVRNLRKLSPCNRTCDYMVRLLTRSLFTILQKMIHAFGGEQDKLESDEIHPTCFPKGHSLSALMQSSVHPSAYSLDLLYLSLHPDKDRSNKKEHQTHQLSSSLREKHMPMKPSHHIGPFKGCINVETDSPLIDGYCRTEIVESTRAASVSGNDVRIMDYKDMKMTFVSHRIYYKLASFYAKRGCLITPPRTLGHAALAVHYANVIVLIEKLASSPHLISLDMRDDLYQMLPASIRTALRARLRLHAKSLTSMVHDGAIMEKWRTTVAQMLKWLAPLAHNTIKWQSERSFEKQNRDSGANVLLVQTLYFADQPKTEEAILELLVGLNHICRIGRGTVRAERLFRETRCST